MKLALMAVLLLGISLINITRLQTRAESPPAAVDDKEQISRTPQAAADEPAATKPDSKQLPGLVTVQAPVTKLNVVPFTVTKINAARATTASEFVPQQVVVEPSIDAPRVIATRRRRSGSCGIHASANVRG